MTEFKIQSDFHKYIWNNFPKTRFLCYHIPNQAKRTGYAYMIAMGMVKGIPDYHINFPSLGFRSLYIEFKSETGKISDAQKECHHALRMAYHKVEVVNNFQEALKIFLSYVEGTEFM